jgi:hypothetical protein
MPVSDTRNLASGVRKVEFKLSHLLTSSFLLLLHILLMSRQTASVARGSSIGVYDVHKGARRVN